MANFQVVTALQKPNNVNNTPRLTQQGIRPTTVKPAGLAQTTLGQTDQPLLGPISIANGNSATLFSFAQNLADPKIRLGAVPYCLAFFEGSFDVQNLIMSTKFGYQINGPLAMPNFTPYAIFNPFVMGGNDTNDLVYMTEITNNTGSTKIIYAVEGFRLYTPIGSY